MLLLLLQLQIQTAFEQLRPDPSTEFKKSHDRAVIMINGLKPHPFSGEKPNEALPASWQAADSNLGRALDGQADLYRFSYSQNAAVGELSEARNKDGKTLADSIAAVRALGYTEVVLIGFSAGGLIARQFVEDHPDAGVTRVVQVCSPNLGTSWGLVDAGVREPQEVFINSLSRKARRDFNKARTDKKIPPAVEFVVVMGTGGGSGDTVVKNDSQWPVDLQEQGVPVVEVKAIHYLAIRGEKGAKKVAELATTPQPRWSAERVEKARKDLLDGS